MHYAFRYFDSENTTTGIPNSRTGRLSIAGHLSVFTSKSGRDAFVGRTEAVADSQTGPQSSLGNDHC